METATESVTEYVRSLPAGTHFRLRDLPVAGDTASVVMHRLLKRGDPHVERIAPGFFMRREDRGEEIVWRNAAGTALIHAGPGSGFAGYTAVNMVGWTTQVPWRKQVCVLGGRRLTPVDKSVVYCNRYNTARAELTWAEVTMLEAVMRFDLAEVSWHEALHYAEDEVCLSRLGSVGYMPFMRSASLRIAGHAERNKPKAFHERVDNLCDRLPEVQDWVGYVWRKHPDLAASWGLPEPEQTRQDTADAA